MSKEFTVNLTEQQRFDVFQFLSATVQPKDRKESRALKGVWESLELAPLQRLSRKHIREQVAAGKKGDALEMLQAEDFSDEVMPFTMGSVDLNQAIDYLDKPGANAVLAMRLLDVSDELLRAKEVGRSLQAVPEEKGA
jgi:hypothetical protein